MDARTLPDGADPVDGDLDSGDGTSGVTSNGETSVGSGNADSGVGSSTCDDRRLLEWTLKLRRLR